MKQLNDDDVDHIALVIAQFIQEYFGDPWPDKNELDIIDMIINELEPYSNGERNWN